MTTSLSAARAVLFDHDGTLVNSLPTVIAATNAALRDHGYPEDSPERIVDAMRHPTAPRMGLHAGVSDPALQRELATTFYRVAWDYMDRATLYPGVLELLQTLHSDGWKLGLVTNNLGQIARHICARTGAMEYLAVAIGEEDMPRVKPAPDGVLQAAAGLGVAIEQCVFVGDSVTDLGAAQAAQIPAIGVTWGAHAREELAAAGFAAVIDRVDQFQGALDGITFGAAES